MKKKVMALAAVAVFTLAVPTPAQAEARLCVDSDQQAKMSHIRFFWTWFFGTKCL